MSSNQTKLSTNFLRHLHTKNQSLSKQNRHKPLKNVDIRFIGEKVIMNHTPIKGIWVLGRYYIINIIGQRSLIRGFLSCCLKANSDPLLRLKRVQTSQKSQLARNKPKHPFSNAEKFTDYLIVKNQKHWILFYGLILAIKKKRWLSSI